MITSQRAEEMCVAAGNGRNQSDVVKTPEELAFWQELIPEVAALREQGQVDAPWEPDPNFLSHLYRPSASPRVAPSSPGS